MLARFTKYVIASIHFLQALLHDQPFIFKPGKLAKIIHKGFAENKDVSSKKDTLLDKVQVPSVYLEWNDRYRLLSRLLHMLKNRSKETGLLLYQTSLASS